MFHLYDFQYQLHKLRYNHDHSERFLTREYLNNDFQSFPTEGEWFSQRWHLNFYWQSPWNHHALCFYDVIETRDLRNVRRQYYEYNQRPRHSYIYFQTRADKNLLINLKSQLNFAKVISCFGLIWFVVCTRRATNTRRYPVNGFPLFSLAANSSSLSCL